MASGKSSVPLKFATGEYFDDHDLSLPRVLSSRFIQPTQDSLFSYGYVFREVEEELLLQYEKEGPVVMEHVSWDSFYRFLCKFFAPSVVEGTLLTFLEMKDSSLGQKYFLRGGVSMLGLRILNNIREEFGEFYSKSVTIPENIGGPMQAQDLDWTVVTRSKSKQNQIGGGSSSQGGSSTPGGSSSQGSRGGGGRRGGRRGGGRRGRGRGSDHGGGGDSGEDIAFLDVSMVEIILPAFSTPDKYALPSSEVRQTIGDRSGLYDTQVQEYLQDTPGARVYAPELVQHGSVFLFHGMRQSSWPLFRRLGIRPRVVPNEFSTTGAFYLTNSVRHAFEHPLHQHPRRNTTDFISVLVFIVPVLVLHGEADAPGGSDPFRVKWFEQADAEWKDFCHNNLVVRQLPNHSYDFVIGPTWLPAGVGRVSDLRIDGFAPTQIHVVRTELENGLHRRPPQFAWKSANQFQVHKMFRRRVTDLIRQGSDNLVFSSTRYLDGRGVFFFCSLVVCWLLWVREQLVKTRHLLSVFIARKSSIAIKILCCGRTRIEANARA